jgi:hypothetical protein
MGEGSKNLVFVRPSRPSTRLCLVSEAARPPIAIRSLRPYATEEDFLAEERDTLSRTAITLIGAPSRPRGVVIRFELTLSDGTPLVRGEGRVLGFQAADEQGPSSLTLRFTRLDAKSKALVDRAASIRESGAPPAADTQDRVSDTEPPVDDDPLASTSVGATVPPSLDEAPPSLPLADEELLVSLSSPALPLADAEEVGPVLRPQSGPRAKVNEHDLASADSDAARRDGLLERLRTRARTLSPSQVATILAPRGPASD